LRTFDGPPDRQIDAPESVRHKEGTESEVIIQGIEDGHRILEASGRPQHACLHQKILGLPAQSRISFADLNLLDYMYL